MKYRSQTLNQSLYINLDALGKLRGRAKTQEALDYIHPIHIHQVSAPIKLLEIIFNS